MDMGEGDMVIQVSKGVGEGGGVLKVCEEGRLQDISWVSYCVRYY